MMDDDGGNHTLVHATPLQFSRGAWFKHIKHSSGPPLDPLDKGKSGFAWAYLWERWIFFSCWWRLHTQLSGWLQVTLHSLVPTLSSRSGDLVQGISGRRWLAWSNCSPKLLANSLHMALVSSSFENPHQSQRKEKGMDRQVYKGHHHPIKNQLQWKKKWMGETWKKAKIQTLMLVPLTCLE